MADRLAASFYAHDDCGCRKAPIVGARYRKMGRDLLTGKETGMRFYTVTAVEPLRHDRIVCRRVTLKSDCGWVGHPQVQALFEGRYEAIDNIVPLGRRTAS